MVRYDSGVFCSTKPGFRTKLKTARYGRLGVIRNERKLLAMSLDLICFTSHFIINVYYDKRYIMTIVCMNSVFLSTVFIINKL